MATSFPHDDSGEGFWPMLGALLGGADEWRTLQSDQVARRTKLFTNSSDARAWLTETPLAALNAAALRIAPAVEMFRRGARRMTMELVAEEQELPIRDEHVTDAAVRSAIDKLIRFMIEDSETIESVTIGSSVSYDAANTGDGALIIGLLSAENGEELGMVRAEDLELECVETSQRSRRLTAGRERFRIRGRQPVPGLHHEFLSRGGSGIDATIAASHGAVWQERHAGGNLLKQGDLEHWTTNVPDDWSLDVGTAGTHLQKLTGASVFKGSASGCFVGDGTTETALTLPLDDAIGLSPIPARLHALSLWMREGASAPTSGVLRCAVVDSNGTVLNDGGSLPDASFEVNETSLSGSWANFAGVLVMPPTIPAGCELELKWTTPLSNFGQVYFDDIVLQPMVQPHAAGPAFAIHSGATAWALRDRITATITNDRALNEWMAELDAALGWYELGMRPPPTAGSPTIANSLIQ